MNRKNRYIRHLYRGINEFKRDYQPRINLVKDENCDLLADCSNILSRWESYFSQLFDVHNVCDVRQIEIHTDEPLIPNPSCFIVEIAIAMLKKHQQNLFKAEMKHYGLRSINSSLLWILLEKPRGERPLG
jgi:hypothetical protein